MEGSHSPLVKAPLGIRTDGSQSRGELLLPSSVLGEHQSLETHPDACRLKTSWPCCNWREASRTLNPKGALPNMFASALWECIAHINLSAVRPLSVLEDSRVCYTQHSGARDTVYPGAWPGLLELAQRMPKTKVNTPMCTMHCRRQLAPIGLAHPSGQLSKLARGAHLHLPICLHCFSSLSLD